ncbi:MAG TPA: NUDIX hydrolase [Bacillota bacterium]|nr:NUDIX hydrolase [Bacillota bacterium]
MSQPRKWALEETETMFKNSFLRLSRERCSHPELGSHNFYVLGLRDWVNITPVTREGKLLLVRQYRRGTDEITTEIPSGSMDRGENAPLSAAYRELREETGYAAGVMTPLCRVAVNPAIQDNYCHMYLATDCTYEGELQPDATEEIEVLQLTPDEVEGMLSQGEIKHSLGVLGLTLALQVIKAASGGVPRS